MAYSDFSIKDVKHKLNIKIIENESLFSQIPELEISDYLKTTLKRNVPLALSINTEKARSELIIINILLETKEKTSNTVSLFSGIDFTVEKEKGLNGFCDYIMSASSEQLYLEIPVITIVEAKNENIISGIGQCVAEMVAAKILNEKENHIQPHIYGAVTTGDEWKFIKLTEKTAFVDIDSYYINEINRIIGILVNMVEAKA